MKLLFRILIFLYFFIEHSKCDQLKSGNSVIVSKTDNMLCPVSLLKIYIAAAGLTLNSNEYLFRKIRFLKKRKLCFMRHRFSFVIYLDKGDIFRSNSEQRGR